MAIHNLISPALTTITGTRTGGEYQPMHVLAITQREGEDAKITGMTRSLQRRLLALNVRGTVRPYGVKSVSPALVNSSQKQIA